MSVPLTTLSQGCIDSSPPQPEMREVDEENRRAASINSSHSNLPKWNKPAINLWRFAAANYTFIILGANDAAYGAVIPYIEKHYNISYTVVSLIFLSPLGGYAAAATFSNMIHMKLGQRGIAFLGPCSHILAYVAVCLHPPYPALIVAFIFAGFGNGIADAAWNAWIGGMENANELLGLLHGFYGLGGMLAPLIATALITKAGWEWYEFYYLLAGASFLSLTFSLPAFWSATGSSYREAHKDSYDELEGHGNNINAYTPPVRANKLMVKLLGKTRMAEALSNRVTWICSRMILGFVTPRCFKTEKHAVVFYLGCCIGLDLVFWLVPNFYASAIAVAFMGFFLGPLFPAGVVAATKLLPRNLHVAAIGFTSAMGASGASTLPFAVGAIAQAKGVESGCVYPVFQGATSAFETAE
ncbi:MFS transporter [Trichophyton equinum CBS 127.97]|uniref:MFS transporter n=1 Tax=Trichophyton equinum (strain ATCC MYA-4606 / CBS 127.97) TaxID=559882 RepID=F2PSI1_TRIEC|nr:MFS transporter [Trichophyton equinum CBS 127.97]